MGTNVSKNMGMNDNRGTNVVREVGTNVSRGTNVDINQRQNADVSPVDVIPHPEKIQVSLAICGGYVPDKFQTANTKTGSLGLN